MWILDPKSPGKENVSDDIWYVLDITVCMCIFAQICVIHLNSPQPCLLSEFSFSLWYRKGLLHNEV